jgi:hypothetical protein
VGFEPTTCGLRNRCSTAELLQQTDFWHFFRRGGINFQGFDTTSDTTQLNLWNPKYGKKMKMQNGICGLGEYSE